MSAQTPTTETSDAKTETQPTIYEKGEKMLADMEVGAKKAYNDAAEFVAGMMEEDIPAAEGAAITEESEMHKGGKRFIGDLKENIASTADSVSKSLGGAKPAPGDKSAESGLTIDRIVEVTKHSLAATADALSASIRGPEGKKSNHKCKNPNCSCTDCDCAEGTCNCGTDGKEGCCKKCKNPDCSCTVCECAEGACKCGTGRKGEGCKKCKNPDCSCTVCECAEGACKCGTGGKGEGCCKK